MQEEKKEELEQKHKDDGERRKRGTLNAETKRLGLWGRSGQKVLTRPDQVPSGYSWAPLITLQSTWYLTGREDARGEMIGSTLWLPPGEYILEEMIAIL